MKFTNPNFRPYGKKINNEVKDEPKETKNQENIVQLGEIMNMPEKNTVTIEYIDCPTKAIITGVPRNTFLSLEQSGKKTINYENSLDNVNKTI